MRRKINIDQQKLLIDNISKYKNNIWCPKINLQMNKVNNNTWFTEYCSINKKVNVLEDIRIGKVVGLKEKSYYQGLKKLIKFINKK